MNQRIQLYIENEQVDVFQDGSINLVSSIKDFRSPDKLFTDFTRNFSLPATSRNNKVFKHFYDYDITEGGFDARSAKEARLEINDRPFREGYITLDSVDMKYNKANAYKITFYGNLRTLKELFNNLKLRDLDFLDEFDIRNKAYDGSNNDAFYDYMTSSKNFLDSNAMQIGSGNGVKKTFQLINYNPYPISTSDFRVYVNGVEESTSNYTYDRNEGTITFTTAPSSGNITTRLFFTQPIVVPLISTTERLYYSSDTNFYGELNDGNLYFGNNYVADDNANGLKFEYLKPAIRIDEIIRAIEKKVNKDSNTANIEFSNDFFNTANLDYYKLYMWLNNDVEETSLFSSTPKETKINTFSIGTYYANATTYGYQTSTYSVSVVDSVGSTSGQTGNKLIVSGVDNDFIDVVDCELLFSTQSSSNYSVKVLKDGIDYVNFGSDSGTRSESFYVEQDGEYEVVITTDDSVAVNFDGGFQAQFIARPNSERYNITNITVGAGPIEIVAGDGFFSIRKNMPDMTIIDFLSGLFKMFNLVCYVEGETNTSYTYGQSNTKRIRVMTFDAYYSSSNNEIDITDKIDITSSSVERVLPYSQIEFKYEDTEAILADQHKNQFGLEWGGERWDAPQSRGEKKYEIKPPFAHMKFERLRNSTDGTLTDLQVGYSIKKGNAERNTGSTSSSFEEQKYNPHIGKPLLFYPELKTSGTQIPYLSRNATGFTSYVTATGGTTSYFIPMNSIDTEVTSLSNHFGQEVDEYIGESSNINNLFNLYYKNYITHLFDIKSRLVKVKANLTNAFLSKFSLADKIRISGKTYSINKIDVNLSNGKANLELQRYYSIKAFSCLSAEFNVSVEVTSAGNVYYFDNKYGAYQMGQGTYVLNSVPAAHPIAFHNFGKEDRITYTGTTTGGTKAGLDGNTYTYYSGTVTVTVNGDFGTISYECYNHGYMGGEDNLIYNADCVAESSPIAPPAEGTLTVDATDIYVDSGIITADQTDQ